MVSRPMRRRPTLASVAQNVIAQRRVSVRKMRLIGAVLALSVVAAACSDSDKERVNASWPDKITFGFVRSEEHTSELQSQ